MFNVNLTKEEYGYLQAALQHFQKDYDAECSTTNQAPSMKRPLVIGRAEVGLYFLCPNCLKTLNSFSLSKFLLEC
ncbi:hypothetical protein KY285_023259 [Solanum tuberosum]|nr:hypothetical protein KY289_023594 [Solanum tuberosum]KAH0675458.1 hypothetical protein KY285_023259 [Solanum tuberosum]